MSAADSPASTKSVLIRRVRAGDDSAYRELLDWAGPQVLRWCQRLRLSDADTQDVSQDAFLAVFQNINTFTKRPNAGGFRAWLWTIVAHKAADLWRKRKHVPLGEAELLVQDATPPESDLAERNEALWAACSVARSQFTETSWRAFWLTVVEGRPAAEVASELSMSPAAVRKAKSRVLAAIRAERIFWQGAPPDAQSLDMGAEDAGETTVTPMRYSGGVQGVSNESSPGSTTEPSKP